MSAAYISVSGALYLPYISTCLGYLVGVIDTLVAGFESRVPCTAVAGGPRSGLGNTLYLVSHAPSLPGLVLQFLLASAAAKARCTDTHSPRQALAR